MFLLTIISDDSLLPSQSAYVPVGGAECGLEESLQIIARRVQQGEAVGSQTNVDSSKVNNLIGKYQLLMELRASEAQKQS